MDLSKLIFILDGKVKRLAFQNPLAFQGVIEEVAKVVEDAPLGVVWVDDTLFHYHLPDTETDAPRVIIVAESVPLTYIKAKEIFGRMTTEN